MLSPSTALRTCLSKHGAGFFNGLLSGRQEITTQNCVVIMT
jgi:hypothetical protein